MRWATLGPSIPLGVLSTPIRLGLPTHIAIHIAALICGDAIRELFEMNSRTPPEPAERTASARWIVLLKLAVGVGILAFLISSNQLDLSSVLRTAGSGSVFVTCLVLMYATIPIVAWRWKILLKTFGLTVTFRRAFHITAIGAAGNVVLLGALGGDALRLIYARRAVGAGTGRIALSIVTDRALGFLALLSVAAAVAILYWERLERTPPLALLGQSVLLVTAAAVILILTLILLPPHKLIGWLQRWPRLQRVASHAAGVVHMVRANPMRLVMASSLAMLCQLINVAVIILIAHASEIGTLAWSDYGFAGPLTLIANALPITPNGLGIGEVAFDQMCHWFEPRESGAAYSSIFFAFRVVGVIITLPGLLSFMFAAGD